MAKTTAAEVRAGERSVRVSSPDRVIYEATATTPDDHQADGRRVRRERRGRPDARPARAAHRARALAERGAGGDAAGDGAAGQGRGGVLPEAGAEGRPRLRAHRRGALPLRADGGGDLPRRDRGPGLVRPHGHADLPPLAGTPRRRRPPRRAAHRPRPAAGHVVQRRRTGGGAGAGAARGARHARVRQDLRQPRRARLRAHRAALGVRRRAPRRYRVRPRAGEARPRSHHRLVEGGARRADLRGLQPEQPRPHHRLGVLAAPAARRPGLHPAGVGGARPSSPTRVGSTC